MILLVFLQATRAYEAETRDHDNGLETLLHRPVEEIDTVVLEYEKRFAITTIHLRATDWLAFPSSGIFTALGTVTPYQAIPDLRVKVQAASWWTSLNLGAPHQARLDGD